MMKNIIIIGATSAIATQYAELEAKRGSRFVLVARSRARLIALRDRLVALGSAGAHDVAANLEDHTSHARIFETAAEFFGVVDVVLVAHGILPKQDLCLENSVELERAFTINATSTLLLISRASMVLRSQNHGTLAAISSVAGDRGRASNFVYGSAKAAVTAFTSGLRQSLQSSGVSVLTIKPGLVDTPMTSGFKKGALWTSPDRVAQGILRAIDRRRSVVYLPSFWWFVMAVIKHIPEFIFRRLRFL